MSRTQDELAKMHWRDRWEYEATQEYNAFLALSEEALIDRVRRGDVGNYYQIWRAIARKGTVAHSAQVLWEYLQSHPGDNATLHRYHCTGALFHILDMPDPSSKSDLRRRVQWDHDGEAARQRALDELWQVIVART